MVTKIENMGGEDGQDKELEKKVFRDIRNMVAAIDGYYSQRNITAYVTASNEVLMGMNALKLLKDMNPDCYEKYRKELLEIDIDISKHVGEIIGKPELVSVK